MLDLVEEGYAQPMELLQDLNNRCGFRGAEIKVESTEHRLDWSDGRDLIARITDLQKTGGTFHGYFIGYLALVLETDLGHERPFLTTVLQTTYYDFDNKVYQPLLVATPIARASIDFCL